MGQVTSVFARKVIQQIHPSLDKRRFLEDIGVDPDSEPDPAHMIESRVHYALWERIARAEPEGFSLPIRVGKSMQCDDYGAFGLAWKTALSLGRSFDRAARYGRVLTSVTQYDLEQSGSGTLFHLRREGERGLGLRLSNEASLASVVAISRQVCAGPFSPQTVFFTHAQPENVAAHEAYFGCEVVFGADKDALLVNTADLDIPNRLGDASVSSFFQSHLEAELEKLPDDAGLERRVRIQISQQLSEGLPGLSEIAARLGMSGRTLQRRLAERGYVFQTLVDEARRELAQRLLRETQYPLAQIAFLTGFSEQSAFNRAFKRWAGQTPRSFRIKVQ
ncbi:MAG: AraC-like DNA-binding protein [Halieaceae bacterium]|jgi:AraC-like DNA-binding protein